MQHIVTLINMLYSKCNFWTSACFSPWPPTPIKPTIEIDIFLYNILSTDIVWHYSKTKSKLSESIICPKCSERNDLLLRRLLICTTTWTFPSSRRYGVESNTERVKASVTMVAEHHLILQQH